MVDFPPKYQTNIIHQLLISMKKPYKIGVNILYGLMQNTLIHLEVR